MTRLLTARMHLEVHWFFATEPRLMFPAYRHLPDPRGITP